MPLPTMTASCSGTRELAELVVGDDVPLLRAELLHPREQLSLRIVVEVEPELLCLDADRVDPALLAEHDSALRPDDVGRVRLDCLRFVELARDRTGLAAEQVVTDERLVRLELVPGERLQPLGERAHPVEPEVRLDAVEPAERERDLGQVAVARALSHPVDGAL